VLTPYAQPAYADANGDVGYWTRMQEGQLVVKETFGQPIDATASEVEPQVHNIINVVGPNLYLEGQPAPISLFCGQSPGSFNIRIFDLANLVFDAFHNPIQSGSAADLGDANDYLQRFQPADVRFGQFSIDTVINVIEHVISGHVVPYLNNVGENVVLGEPIPATMRLCWTTNPDVPSVHEFDKIYSTIEFDTVTQHDDDGNLEYASVRNFFRLSDDAFITDGDPLSVDIPLFNFHGMYVRSRYALPVIPDGEPDLAVVSRERNKTGFHRA